MMHVVQTLTAIHDRYLDPSKTPRRSVTEMYHLSQAATSYNMNLSAGVEPGDRDALWGTAILLGIISFASLDVSDPREAWPFRDPDPSDLEWLGLSHGKKTVWRIANPMRSDSIFYPLVDEYIDNATPATTLHWAQCVPPAFISLYGLDDMTTTEDNPYEHAVQTLAPLLKTKWTRYNNQRFFYFVQSFQPVLKNLLKQKDPRALLLLAYWYSTICDSMWWMSRRAIVECQSICLYLERDHGDEETILDLLQLPRTKCGLAPPKRRPYIPWFGSLT